MSEQILFAMTGAMSVPGGVSEVNLAILRTLSELVQERGLRCEVMSFAETDCDRPPFLPSSVGFRGYGMNKIQFALDLIRSTASRPLYFFDYVRLASPLIPFVTARIVKTILFAHGIEYWKEMCATDRLSIRFASRILTNSNYTLDRMKATAVPFNGVACTLGLSVRTVLNATPPAAPSDPLSLNACDDRMRPIGDRVLLLAARINQSERYKGHYPLMRVLPDVMKRHPDVQLVFPGSGDDHQGIAAYARDQGIAASVFLPGYLSREALDDLYRRCYAYVMPSTCEGFGLAHLEAMNFAKPCVGCFDDGAADVIRHGETGYLVRNPNDAGELTSVLLRLLDNPSLAEKMGLAGFERLHAYFTPEQFRGRVRSELLAYL